MYAQVDRGVPFNLALSLKEGADKVATEEISRLEKVEERIKAAQEEVLSCSCATL